MNKKPNLPPGWAMLDDQSNRLKEKMNKKQTSSQIRIRLSYLKYKSTLGGVINLDQWANKLIDN